MHWVTSHILDAKQFWATWWRVTLTRANISWPDKHVDMKHFSQPAKRVWIKKRAVVDREEQMDRDTFTDSLFQKAIRPQLWENDDRQWPPASSFTVFKTSNRLCNLCFLCSNGSHTQNHTHHLFCRWFKAKVFDLLIWKVISEAVSLFLL